MTDTLEALEALTRSEGWRLLCDEARREWAERERIGVKNVVSGKDQDTVDKLRQIVAAREAVEWVLALPNEVISTLGRRKAAESAHTAINRSETARLAALSPELMATMSRRGGL